jgi:hypothetical protein
MATGPFRFATYSADSRFDSSGEKKKESGLIAWSLAIQQNFEADASIGPVLVGG